MSTSTAPSGATTEPTAAGLGTFLGVFTPTILTILGAIMYLRMGWVVAEAGMWGAIAIVVVANTITLITALSMATLATNMRVGVGGAYFLISRSFGLEIGGAIGIPLYLSQVFALALYAYALAEVGLLLTPDLWTKPIAALVVVGVTAIAARSTQLALKLQLPILGFIALSIVALLIGVDVERPQVSAWGGPQGAGFWAVFAVFFPAVTGILTGLSLSGDLRDPSRAITVGGLSATALGFVIYVVLAVALAYGAPPEVLVEPMAWTRIAVGGVFTVFAGLAFAILSSAIGSVLSAPRTLQALAVDRAVPHWFAQVDAETGEPLRGVYVSGGLALAVVLVLQDLDAVASLVTMFFLTTYGALNLVAGLEGLTGDPSFRPVVRTPWAVSMLGAFGCLAAMLSIAPRFAVAAVLLECVVFYALTRRSLASTFGDARSGVLLSGARFALMQLRSYRIQPRNWRPHLLVFTSDLRRTLPVVRLADQFGQRRGIVTVVHLLSTVEEAGGVAERTSLQRTDGAMLEQHGITAFNEVTVVPDLDDGVLTVAQANGMAGLQSNTVMFGYHRDDDGPPHLARLLRLCGKLAGLDLCSVLFVPSTSGAFRQGPIQVWWAGRENNGDLMLLLAYLVTLSAERRGARIELKSIVSDEAARVEMERDFAAMLPEVRIPLTTDVKVRPADQTWQDVLRADSIHASLVFLGLPVERDPDAYAAELDAMLEGLPDTCLVHNAGPFRGRLV